jgi:hypothetical protein
VQSTPWKKQYTINESALNKPMTPESPIPESKNPETKNTPDSMTCIDTAQLRPTSKYKRKPDIYSAKLAMDKDYVTKSDRIHYNTISMDPIRQRTESPPVPKQDPPKSISFLATVHQIVDIIHLLNQYQTNLLYTIYQRILQSLHTTQEQTRDLTTNQ